MIPLYSNIKKRRKELRMTQDEIAQKVGYTGRSAISKVELGGVDLPYSKICAFAEVLRTTPVDLMGSEIDNVYDTETQEFLEKYYSLSENDRKEFLRMISTTLTGFIALKEKK